MERLVTRKTASLIDTYNDMITQKKKTEIKNEALRGTKNK